MQLQPATQSIESVITTHTVFDEVTRVFFFSFLDYFSLTCTFVFKKRIL